MTDSAIFDGHSAILGRVGSGKTFAARGIVETWLAQSRRVCVIDPTGVWWGLRADAAGTGAGFPIVVFGGDHADVQIGDRSGEKIGELIGGRNLPAVVSTSEMTAGERHRFMGAFLASLYLANNRVPLHLVIDEADDIAPQNPLPENRRMLGEVERIVRRGRVRGFRVMMISQRSAVLNKNVLTQASTLVAMRMPAKQDRDAVEGWIRGQADRGEADELLGSLSRLQRGEGWIWAPEEGVLLRQKFPAITTFDSMRTPEHGEEIAAPTRLAAVEIGDLRSLLDADEEGAPAPRTDKAALAAAERRGYDRGIAEFKAEIRSLEQRLRAGGEAIDAAVRHLSEAAAELTTSPKTKPNGADQEKYSRNYSEPATAIARSEPDTRQQVSAEQILPQGERACLMAIAQHRDGITRVQISALVGYKRSSRDTYLQRLAARSYISRDSGRWVATPAGIAALGPDFVPLPTGAALRRHWLSKLPEGERRVLEALVAAYPNSVARPEIDRQTGYKRSSRDTYLQRLRARELIAIGPDGATAADILFDGTQIK